MNNAGIVLGNWKMYGSKATVTALLQALIADHKAGWKAELAVLVPSVFLDLTQRLLAGSAVSWGAQVVSEHEKGAYTGEVSGGMLAEFGCRYVLVGHSERRLLYGETDAVVALKYKAAVKAGLVPVLCVGETLSEHALGHSKEVICRQIDAVIGNDAGLAAMRYNPVIAYEPVWAIGTGLAASPGYAQSMHAAIREQVAHHDRVLASALKILYGGSLKAENAKDLFAMPDITGGLVGGASLNASEFLEIGRLCNNY